MDEHAERLTPGPTGAAGIVGDLCRAHLARSDGEIAVSRSTGNQYAGVLFASNDQARTLETLQEGVGVGPGPSALRTRTPVLVEDLSDDPRTASWVGYLEPAVAMGVRSVYALPLQVGAICIGLLTLHALEPHGLSSTGGMPALLRLSDAVTATLLDSTVTRVGRAGGAPQPFEPLDPHHAVTHQAVGMVSVQLASSVTDAFAMLRAHAFGAGRSLVDVAHDVVERRLRFGEIGAEARGGPGAHGEYEGDDDDR